MSGYLVGSAAFKAVGTSDPRPAGSIPVHLRHQHAGQMQVLLAMSSRWSQNCHARGTSVADDSPYQDVRPHHQPYMNGEVVRFDGGWLVCTDGEGRRG